MEYAPKEHVLPPLNPTVAPSIIMNLTSVSNNLKGVKATAGLSKDMLRKGSTPKPFPTFSSPASDDSTAKEASLEKVVCSSQVIQPERTDDDHLSKAGLVPASGQERREMKRKFEGVTSDSTPKKILPHRDTNDSDTENPNLKPVVKDEIGRRPQLPLDPVAPKLTDNISVLPLPAGFGEVELEAIRILGSFSQPRDASGPSHLDGNSSINSSRATSVEYTPPHQQQQQQQQHQQPQSLQPHPALPLPLALPQLQLHPHQHQHQHQHHVGSPLLGPRLMYDTSNQSSPMSSRANSPSAPPSQRVGRRGRGSVRAQHHSEPVSPASSGVDELRSDDEGKSPGMFRCEHPHCGKTFGRLYNLKSHTRTHTDDRPFKCDQCEQAFSRNHDLKRHQKIHTGIKPFECTACGKKFSRMDALGRHRAKKPECLEKA